MNQSRTLLIDKNYLFMYHIQEEEKMEKESQDIHAENMFMQGIVIENEHDMFLLGIHTGNKNG